MPCTAPTVSTAQFTSGQNWATPLLSYLFCLNTLIEIIRQSGEFCIDREAEKSWVVLEACLGCEYHLSTAIPISCESKDSSRLITPPVELTLPRLYINLAIKEGFLFVCEDIALSLLFRSWEATGGLANKSRWRGSLWGFLKLPSGNHICPSRLTTSALSRTNLSHRVAMKCLGCLTYLVTIFDKN